ncbi:MAG TPA: beta-glucosidase, partial [Bacteroidaceae bacterium]|nr:beta-glucosidase [Bacteroidaceae bacterium]
YMYDQNKPLFAFGHGLSFATFEYRDLKKDRKVIRDGETAGISLVVKNTGMVDSDEVVQLYAGFPGSKVQRPIKALKGFRRIFIPAGESVEVTIPLNADELKYWDETENAFVLEKGEIELMIGASSEDIRLTGTLKVK